MPNHKIFTRPELNDQSVWVSEDENDPVFCSTTSNGEKEYFFFDFLEVWREFVGPYSTEEECRGALERNLRRLSAE
jgi:hypothetical protein